MIREVNRLTRESILSKNMVFDMLQKSGDFQPLVVGRFFFQLCTGFKIFFLHPRWFRISEPSAVCSTSIGQEFLSSTVLQSTSAPFFQ